MKSSTQNADSSLKMILETLDHGYFVFDRGGVIQAEVSLSARRLFGHELTGAHVLDVLQFDEARRESAASWLDLVFGGHGDFESMMPLAPRIFENEGRLVALNFYPVFSEGANSSDISKIVCISADRTEELNFKKKAEAEFTLVQVVMAAVADRAGFVAFVLETKRAFKELFHELASAVPRVDAVFRLVHSIKGNLAAYYFAEGSRLAHHLETKLSDLKAKPARDFQAWLPEMRGTLETILKRFEGFLQEHAAVLGETKEATDRSKSLTMQSIYDMSRLLMKEVGPDSVVFKEFTETFVQDEVTSLFHRYENVAKGIAERQEKKLNFLIQPSAIRVMSEPYLPMSGAYVHVFRNAVDHGIETPEARVAAGKPEEGTISMSFEVRHSPSGKEILRVEVADDGKGVDANLVRRKAIEKNVAPEADLLKMDDDQVVQLLFHTGFSTRDEVSDLSGRGVGLDAVQYEVERLGGRVWIETESGQGAKVIAEVPLISALAETLEDGSRLDLAS